MRVKAFLDNAYRLIFARDVATSQPIFYVATTGSDSNNGLTVGTPFLTLQKAIDVLTTIDCNGFDPIINLAAGTYVQPLGGLVLKSCTGVATRVTIIGEAGANRVNYKIQGQAASPTDTTATTIVKAASTLYRFVGVEIGANFSHSNFPKYVRAATPIEFEDCCFRGGGSTHDCISSFASNTIKFFGIVQLEGTFRWFLDVLQTFIEFAPLGAQKATFLSNNGCTFAIFLNGSNSVCLAFDTLHTGGGGFTGKRFELIEGLVQTYGTGAGLPGDSVGTEVAAAITAHEATFNHSTFATTTQLTNLRNEVGMIGDPFSNAPGTANTAAVITVAAPGAGQRLQVNQIEFSYNAAPTNGTLTIQQGSTVIKTLFVSAAGPGPIITGIRLPTNTALTITLSAGGAGVTGSVNASVLQVAA